MGYADWHFFWKDFKKNKGFRRFILIVVLMIAIFLLLPFASSKIYEFQHRQEFELSDKIASEWVEYLKSKNEFNHPQEVTMHLIEMFDEFLNNKYRSIDQSSHEAQLLKTLLSSYHLYQTLPKKSQYSEIEYRECQATPQNKNDLEAKIEGHPTKRIDNPYYKFLKNNGLYYRLDFSPLKTNECAQ